MASTSLSMPVDADEALACERKHSSQPDNEEENLGGLRREATAIRSNGYLLLLTLGFGGLQTVFALLSSSGSSYLISLGMHKSLLGITWLSGPIAGAILQPYVGICSDQCRSGWGRRRPFILGGSLLIVLATTLLAQAAQVASAVSCLLGLHAAEHSIRMVLAILSVICITCGIQPVQVGLRALIVDRCHTSQQLQANAWAARITGIGNIFGFLAGVVDLPALLPPLKGQFNALSAVTCSCLMVTTGVTCLCVHEKPLASSASRRMQSTSVVRRFRDIFSSARNLPRDIRSVCIVQFFAWMGWFPFMFYISTFTSETYLRQFRSVTGGDQESVPRDVWDHAARQGSASMLIFAIVSFIASALLPIAINSSQRPPKVRNDKNPLHWAPPIRLQGAWAASHVLFGVCMLAPALFPNVVVIKIFVGLVGISWACTIWIPFALITTSISARNARSFVDTVEGPQMLEPATVLALHNVALSVPQALTACLSSGVFWLSSGNESSIPIILGIGALAGLAAAWFTRRLTTEFASENTAREEGIALVSNLQAKSQDMDDDDDNDDDDEGEGKGL